jgi:hypothetical protein
MIQTKELLESIASQQARNLGLTYYGFGRYGKNGMVTHISQAGYLKALQHAFHPSKGESVLLHYTHLEDQLIEKGVKGGEEIIDVLHDLITDPKNIHIESKIDGAPSLFFGKDESTGKFFIATKALHSKDPKIIYSGTDIEKYYKDSPGLKAKLYAALENLPKIYKGHGIMQGDFMYTKDDLDQRHIDGETHHTFKPNVIRNAIPVHSELGHQISKSRIGFAVHTKYNDEGERIPADESDVNKHEDVFLMPIKAMTSDLSVHLPGLQEVGSKLARTKRESIELVRDPKNRALVMQYFNYCVKNHAPSTASGFASWAHDYLSKDIDKLKTEEGKQKKRAAIANFVDQVNQNKHHFDTVFDLHRSIAGVKDQIIDSLDKSQTIKRFFDKGDDISPTGPEGYVAVKSHGTHKLVKRSGFSLQNFVQDKTTWVKKDAAVVTLGRMSPPHIEHSNLVNSVVNHAKSMNADPFVFVTQTQDKKKNPLSADEKLELLKAAHPDQEKIFDKAPGLLHALTALHKKGYKKVTVVLGDDRVNDFAMIHKYNGKFNDKGDGYKFDEVNLISRHDINDTRQGGSDGIHASDLRNAAKKDDFDTFRAGMHPNVSDELVRSTMKKIKSRLNEHTVEKNIDGYIYETGDIILHKHKKSIHEVVDFGPNYTVVVNEVGDISRIWNKDLFLANSLKEDFDDLRRKRSSSNQIAYAGYKTKHFTKEYYELFKSALKEHNDRFFKLSLLRTTDQILENIDNITKHNFVRVKSLVEQNTKLVKKLGTKFDVYLDSISNKIQAYELNK